MRHNSTTIWKNDDELWNYIVTRLLDLPITQVQAEKTTRDLLKRPFQRDFFRETSKTGSIFDFKSKITRVVKLFKDHGLTIEDYLNKAALKQPQLFIQSPKKIEGRIKGVVKKFKKYGLTIEEYLNKAALPMPQLFCQLPDTIEGNILGVVDKFKDHGLTVKKYLECALEQPPLFVQLPNTIEDNILGVVKKFKDCSLTAKEYLTRAALRKPQLFCQSPDTIERNIRDVVENCKDRGLLVEKYLELVLDSPSLFSMKPTTISSHLDIMFEMCDKNLVSFEDNDLFGSIQGTSLSLGFENWMSRLLFCLIVEKEGPRRPYLSSLMRYPRAKIDQKIIDYFGPDSMALYMYRELGIVNTK